MLPDIEDIKILNSLHKEIQDALYGTIKKAINIGERLLQHKEQCVHGEFLNWINKLTFSQKSAYNYMKVAQYKNEIQNCTACTSLQEAYKQVETIEAQAQQSEAERTQTLIHEYKTTGKKPAGWDRTTDYEARKQAKADEIQARIDAAEADRTERIRVMQEELLREHESKTPPRPAPNFDTSEMDKLVAQVIAHEEKRSTFKESIRISHEGKDDPFVDAIMDYLETLDDDNRRIEACINIIKICKGVANQLQKVSA